MKKVKMTYDSSILPDPAAGQPVDQVVNTDWLIVEPLYFNAFITSLFIDFQNSNSNQIIIMIQINCFDFRNFRH